MPNILSRLFGGGAIAPAQLPQTSSTQAHEHKSTSLFAITQMGEASWTRRDRVGLIEA